MSTAARSRRTGHVRSSALAVLGVLTASALLSACASGGTAGATAGSGGTIKIGILASTTGDLSTYGIAEKQGIEVALDEIKKSGGIDGKTVDAVYYDPAGDTATAVQQVNRMVQQDQVQLVLDASASSGVGLAIKPVVQAAGLVMITAGAAAELTTPTSESKLTFGTTLSTDIVAEKMADYLKAKGVTKAGLLSSSDGYGKAGAVSLEAAAKKDGITIQAVEYDPAATDLTPQLRQLQSGGNGATINWTSGASGIVFFKNAGDLDLKASGPVLASFTFSNPALMQQAGGAAEGVTVAGIKATLLDSLSDSDPQKKTIQTFNDALEKQFNVPVTIYAAQAHDMVLVAKAGIQKAGTTSGEKLAAAIQKLSVEGVQGTYDFSADDHRGLSTDNLEMMTWTDGAFVAAKN